MKRLPVIIGVGLVVAGCGAAPAGSLGPVPPGPSRSSSPIPSPGGGPTSTTPSPSGRPTTPAQPTQQPARETSVQLWFIRHGKLFVTEQTGPATTGVGRAALDALLTGPSAAGLAAGLQSQIPPGT